MRSCPTPARIVVRGQERISHSPADARRNGLVSVYQEPAVIPDLDIRDNLRLTSTPIEPFRHWLAELGLGDLNLSSIARRLPLATLRIIDLARALAIEPDVLLLDEITAALPANLTERVLQSSGGSRAPDRSIIFISHRLIEIAAVCDRATVLRNGETVGVVDVTAGSEDGSSISCSARAPQDSGRAAALDGRDRGRAEQTPRLSASELSGGRRLAGRDLRSPRRRGPRAWSPSKDRARTSCSTSCRARTTRLAARCSSTASRSLSGHPADAIRQGVVYVAADRADALLMQRSVRENISLPLSAGSALGMDRPAEEGPRSTRRSKRSRSTPAPRPRCGGCRAATSRK